MIMSWLDSTDLKLRDTNMPHYEREHSDNKATADTLIFDRFRARESLNGEWHYCIDQYDTFLRAGWYREVYKDGEGRSLPVDYSFDEWPVMYLPCCWNNAIPELKWYEGSMAFFRTWHYDRENEGERVFLRIGAANYACRVFINKRFAGWHEGGSTPFNIDITDYLEEDNRIILYCNNTRRPNRLPAMETDWFNYGGVYRDIEIIRVPAVHIRKFEIALKPDHSFDKIVAKVELSDKINTSAELRIHELNIWEKISIIKGHGEIEISASPDLWSPEAPKLYDVSLACNEDAVTDRVGFREISVHGRNIILNGKEIFLKGISCHEDSPITGKALTDEEILGDIKLAKELGCNYMRAAHYPHSEKLSQYADKLGLLLWEEIPVYWVIDFANSVTVDDATNQLSELIMRDYNRASVIIWSVGNENADTDERYNFMGGLADLAREKDGTRPVSAACLISWGTLSIADRLAEKLDIIGLNEYFGWYDPNFELIEKLFTNSNPSKPVIITEFGADACVGYHGDTATKGTEEYQAHVYEQQVEVLGRIPYVKGMTPWILHDFNCPRRTSYIQNYYNTKGLVSADRQYRKPAFHVLRKFYDSLS